MARRPAYRRKGGDIRRGTVLGWPAGHATPAEVAKRTQYVANGEHKDYPSESGLWTYVIADKSKCDRFAPADWPRLAATLREAVEAGTVSEFRGDFPARVWAFVNGRLHEARLSNGGNGSYHAFPLDYEEDWPSDPSGLLAKAVHVDIPFN